MARKSKTVSTREVPLVQNTCGQCGSAYGYCCPAFDGRPICCRCPEHPEFLMSCSQTACGKFTMRSEPAPTKVTERLSVNLYADRIKEKVVPLFRPGEKEPWKVVPVSEIPPQGISWDGSPAKIR